MRGSGAFISSRSAFCHLWCCCSRSCCSGRPRERQCPGAWTRPLSRGGHRMWKTI